MSSDTIQHCYLCSDGNVSAIFISPTRVGSDKLRSKFKLKAQGRSIVFNPASAGKRYLGCTWSDQVINGCVGYFDNRLVKFSCRILNFFLVISPIVLPENQLG